MAISYPNRRRNYMFPHDTFNPEVKRFERVRASFEKHGPPKYKKPKASYSAKCNGVIMLELESLEEAEDFILKNLSSGEFEIRMYHKVGYTQWYFRERGILSTDYTGRLFSVVDTVISGSIA